MTNDIVTILFGENQVVAEKRELGSLVYKGLDVSGSGFEATANVFHGKYGVVALVEEVKTDGERVDIGRKVINGIKDAVSMNGPLVLDDKDALTAVPAFYLGGSAYAHRT